MIVTSTSSRTQRLKNLVSIPVPSRISRLRWRTCFFQLGCTADVFADKMAWKLDTIDHGFLTHYMSICLVQLSIGLDLVV
jgi:hypothetical protein